MTSSTQKPSDKAHTWELLRNRNFMLLWAAYGVSAMGDHLSEMAILKTQHAAQSNVDVTPIDARMTFLLFVPFFLFSPIMGWLADRLPRRGLMITADLVRCVLMLAFTALMVHTSSWGQWGPLLPLLPVGLFAALFSPARSALLPTLIRPDQLVRANGMISGLGVIGTMVAIQIGGWIVQRYENPEIAFRLDAGTFFLSGMILMFLRPPIRQSSGSQGITITSASRELVDGLRYTLCHRRVLELMLIAALVWFCGPLVKCVMPAIVRDVYGGSYQLISSYRALLGVGFIFGAVIISMLGGALRSEITITWGLFGIAASIALFAASVFLPFSRSILAILGGIAVVGAGMFGVAVMASFNALLQRIVANRFRGRVFGLNDLVCTASLLVATGALGVPQWRRVDTWVGYILIGVAILAFAAGVITLRIRLKRRGVRSSLTFAQNLNEFMTKWWWRFQRIGPPTVPHEGPVIVTANHTCSADPLFLSAAVMYRPISFMVAEEYTHWPVARWFMRVIECIPIKREIHDTGATKQAIRHLRSGKALGIFIEGRIVPPGEQAQPKDGVAMLALKTGATVVPAYISGLIYRESLIQGLLTRHHARVRFGKPVDLDDLRTTKPDRETVRKATRRIFAAIQALAPEGSAYGSPEAGAKAGAPREELTHETI